MTKRKHGPHGQGSVHYIESERVWRARGYAHTPSGKVLVARKRKLQADAIRARDEAIREREGSEISRRREIVADYLHDWLHNTARANVTASTFERYKEAVRLDDIVPVLGGVSLVNLSAADVRRLKQALLDKGRAPSTVGTIQGILSNALNQGVNDRTLTVNPSCRVKKPKEKGDAMRTLSEEQARRLVDSVRETRHEALYLTALKVGPRLGELVALYW
jgi:site-specific recombinase XerC